MKKLLFLLLLFAPEIYAQGPAIVLFGSGVPGGGVASVAGTHYVDNSVTPAVTYICTSVSVAAGPNPPAGTQTCNWTQLSGSAQSNPTCASSMTFTVAASFITDFFVNLNCNVTSSTMAGPFGAGTEAVFTISQDVVGGRTFAWPANFQNTPVLAVNPSGVTVATFQYCGLAGNGNACPANSWQNTDVGPSGVTITGSKLNGIDPTDPAYGVKFDGILTTLCSWTNGANPVVVTCPAGVTFTTAINGKVCFGISGPGDATEPVGVATFISATSYSCTGTATATATGSGNSMVCTDDTAAWALVKTAFAALPKGGSIFLPAGYSCTTKGLFNWLTATQGNGGPAVGEFGGITVIGKGSPVSQIIPMPSFDFTSCTPALTCFGSTANAGGTNFSHWAINGMTQRNLGACGAAGTIGVNGINISRISDFVITDWVAGCGTAFVCLSVTGQGSIVDNWSFVDTCGSTAINIDSSDVALFDTYARSGSVAGSVALNVATGLGICSSSHGSTYGPATPFDLVTIQNAACLNSFGDLFESSNSGQTFTFDMSGGTANFFGSTIQVGTTSTSSAFYFRSNTNKVGASGTIIQGGSAQGMFNGAVNGNFYDTGLPNTFTSITGTSVNTFGSSSATGNLVVAGNLVPSANWGTGATVTVPLGDQQNFSFTLTNGSAAVGANPTIAFTFPNATGFLRAPICSVYEVGGTQAITAATEFLTPSASSRTGITLTYNGTPTINLTEFFQGSCH